jgi:hypothetical protein
MDIQPGSSAPPPPGGSSSGGGGGGGGGGAQTVYLAVAARWQLVRAVHWTLLEAEGVYATTAVMGGQLEIVTVPANVSRVHGFEAVVQLSTQQEPRRVLSGVYQALGMLSFAPDPLEDLGGAGGGARRRLLQAGAGAGAGPALGRAVRGTLVFQEAAPSLLAGSNSSASGGAGGGGDAQAGAVDDDSVMVYYRYSQRPAGGAQRGPGGMAGGCAGWLAGLAMRLGSASHCTCYNPLRLKKGLLPATAPAGMPARGPLSRGRAACPPWPPTAACLRPWSTPRSTWRRRWRGLSPRG